MNKHKKQTEAHLTIVRDEDNNNNKNRNVWRNESIGTTAALVSVDVTAIEGIEPSPQQYTRRMGKIL